MGAPRNTRKPRIALPERAKPKIAPPPEPIKAIKNMEEVFAKLREMTEKYKGQYECVTDTARLKEYIDQAASYGRMSIDTETTGLDVFHDKVVGFSISTMFPEGLKSCYVPLRHLSRFTGKIDTSQPKVEEVAAILNSLPQTVTLDYANAQFDLLMKMHSLGVDYVKHPIRDALLAARILNTERKAGKRGLKDIHAELCTGTTRGPRFAELFPPGTFHLCPYALGYTYGARDAEMTWEVMDVLLEMLEAEPDLKRIFFDIEMPLIPVLIKMRERGVLIDQAKRAELTQKYKAKMEGAVRAFEQQYAPYIPKIRQYQMSPAFRKPKGRLDLPVKIGSNDQIRILFYDIMGLPTDGNRGTDKGAIAATNSEIGKALLEYRECQKLLSTYLEGLERFIQEDNTVHSQIRQIGADTGRTSCIAEGTLVSCVDGKKPIEKVQIGDEVYTHNGQGDLCIRKVTRVYDNGYKACVTLMWQNTKLPTKIGTLTCTPDHMIRSAINEWTMADQITMFEPLYSYPEEKDLIDHPHMLLSREDAGVQHVYDLEVEDTHCFIANEICVHNCSDPNLQNIPSRNREIRQMYTARPGYALVSCDYSGQEPRLTASLCRDETMIKTYQEGKDLYSMIAAVAFNTTYEECQEHRPDGELYLEGKWRRGNAKQIVLGICYGRQIPSIAEQLGCTKEEAQSIYDKVTGAFPGLLKAQDEAAEMAHKYGYVTTLWGRRRHLSVMMHDDYEFEYAPGCNPDFDPFNPMADALSTTVPKAVAEKHLQTLQGMRWWKDKEAYIAWLKNECGIITHDYSRQRADTGRKALNARIQGSAADQSKLAMIAIDKDPRLKELDSHLVLMIHDEVICEVPEKNLNKAVPIIKELMEYVSRELPVPFKADAEVSTVWFGKEINYTDEDDIG